MSRKPESSDNTGEQLAPAPMHDRQCSGRELPVGLEERIKDRARRLGFALVGIAAAVPPESLPHLQNWLAQGLAGSMEYMHRQAEARSHPRYVFPEVRSIVVVGLNYKPGHWVSQEELPAMFGRISSYAWGRDYHRVVRKKLRELLRWLQAQVPECRGRIAVDSAPLLERDYARQAGLGWFGKNTMLLNKRYGSFFFLGALLTNLELRPDPPLETSHCGTCTACLEACPTQAFVAPKILDARRCISYLTIEHRGPIAKELRPQIGDWVFGCDVCQEVCPWNRKAPPGSEPELQVRPELAAPDLTAWFEWSEEQFRQHFAGTALWRARRDGLLRNAAIVLGNRKDPRAVPALCRGLWDSSAVVRGAAAWALGQIATNEALSALHSRLASENDPEVREEIKTALASAGQLPAITAGMVR
jgi:epoxyqueuosine reductase